MRIEEFLIDKPVFSTRECANSLDARIDSTSRKLSSLNKNGVISSAGRGLWFNPKHPEFSVYALVPHLVGLEQGYISFFSALNYHGVISQIPHKIFVATTGHARAIKINPYFFELIQIKPEFMGTGIEWKNGFAMASPEKALIDCIYISSRKGKRFQYFSEIDTDALSKTKLKRLVREHSFSRPVESFVNARLEQILGAAH